MNLQPQVIPYPGGFILKLPQNILGGNLFNLSTIEHVEWQVATSTDDSIYSGFQPLADTFAATNFAFVHTGLLNTMYFEYKYRVWTYLANGTSSPSDWSDTTIAGNGSIQGSTGFGNSLDQIATSLGVFQSGILRGVVFETSANYPKVRMDPTGFMAIDGVSTPILFPIDTSTPARFGGSLVNCTLTGFDNSTTISSDFVSNYNTLRWLFPSSGSGPVGSPLAQIVGKDTGQGFGELAIQVAGPTLSTPTLTSLTWAAMTQTGGDQMDLGPRKFVVTAVNGVGETIISNYLATPFTRNNAFAVLSWTPVQFATGYRIYEMYGDTVGGYAPYECPIPANYTTAYLTVDHFHATGALKASSDATSSITIGKGNDASHTQSTPTLNTAISTDSMVLLASTPTGSVSSFLQLGTSTPVNMLAVDTGVGTMTWSGGTISNTVGVVHNLGRVPIAVVGSIQSNLGGTIPKVFTPLTNTFTTTQFSCEGRAVSANTGDQTFYWIAIG